MSKRGTDHVLWKFRERKDGFLLMGVWENLAKQIILKELLRRVWRKMEEEKVQKHGYGDTPPGHRQAFNTDQT